jgi:hypothetical protein
VHAELAVAKVHLTVAMVGDDKAQSGFQTLDPPEGRMPRTSAVLGVLNTSSAAGHRLADAVTSLAAVYGEELAQSAAASPTSVASNDPSLLHAARLLGLANPATFSPPPARNLNPVM